MARKRGGYLIKGKEICTLGMHRNKKERERKNDGQRGRFDRGEIDTTPQDAIQQKGEKKTMMTREGGKSSKKESMHTPGCTTTKETKSFNAKEKEREPQCQKEK